MSLTIAEPKHFPKPERNCNGTINQALNLISGRLSKFSWNYQMHRTKEQGIMNH
jgi:hypothetical protein